MKGVVLAGGLGTRLYPLTYATNKHLLPVYDRPMIFYPIKTLTDAGIDEILVVVGGPYSGHFIRVLKNGKGLGVKHLEFAYQQDEGGISDAISLAEDFADKGPVTVILGDNCTDADIKKPVTDFTEGAMIFIKKVNDPQRFGVPTFDKDRKITKITEKPKKPDSDYAVTGLYIYDFTAFNKIKNLKPSARGELEVTDLNNAYLKEGKLSWSKLNGFWSDAGTFDSLFQVNKYWASKKK
ncbi:NTP transferase domain-containing protein [Candidatus Woesebacteria bacterium]|nr:NTP transferase domain-containing protein [Candidatus Woesebacteria bacterium]